MHSVRALRLLAWGAILGNTLPPSPCLKGRGRGRGKSMLWARARLRLCRQMRCVLVQATLAPALALVQATLALALALVQAALAMALALVLAQGQALLRGLTQRRHRRGSARRHPRPLSRAPPFNGLAPPDLSRCPN